MARRRRRRARQNPIENQALVVGGILAVGIAAAIIFWPKKAIAASSTQPQVAGAPLSGGQINFEPGARDYKLQVGGTITVSIPPHVEADGKAREYHVDDTAEMTLAGGPVLRGTLNQNNTISFMAVGPGKAKVLIDTRGATQSMALNIEVFG